MTAWDLLVVNAAVATMDPGRPGPYGLVADGAVGVTDGCVAWVGRMAELPPGSAATRTLDAGGEASVAAVTVVTGPVTLTSWSTERSRGGGVILLTIT